MIGGKSLILLYFFDLDKLPCERKKAKKALPSAALARRLDTQTKGKANIERETNKLMRIVGAGSRIRQREGSLTKSPGGRKIQKREAGRMRR
ncbi:MAG: hypothetical protein FJZ04_04215 [Candidatus Moranbacteria bacterium]|nr:hypothetical protein [Candidatus Moranbacteria bacterium]